MTDTADLSTNPGARPTPSRSPVARKPRPDPKPLRIAMGLTGLATASALVTAFLGSAAATEAGTVSITTDAANGGATSGAVRHVTRYVQLLPGQTAPPNAIVNEAPAATPRVVVVTTKQSG